MYPTGLTVQMKMAVCAKISAQAAGCKLGLWHPLRDHYNEAEIETHRNYQHKFFSFQTKMNRDRQMAHNGMLRHSLAPFAGE